VPGLVFKTRGAALGVARWVRLPCAPAKGEDLQNVTTNRRPQGHRQVAAEPRSRPPSVERVLANLREVADGRDPDTLRDAARSVIADERSRLAEGGLAAREPEALAREAALRLTALQGAGFPPVVINATGVLIHTNLGRSSWPQAAIDAAVAAASGPLLLELDPESGRRGRRYRAAEEALIALTAAEDALVTNNNAAAVALAVGLAGRGGAVVVSRGELVEIGGGVRIPEIVRRAGAKLVEVGTTNRTRPADYAAALEGGRAKVVLRVHRSNFRQEGFVEDADLAAVAGVAHAHGAIVIDDLGSGALLDTSRFGLPHEPQPSERLAAGADLETFSGDKLVGGPQAGLIVGRRDLVERLRRDPLARAMRPDKVTLVAVAATLGLYRSGRATMDIPLWRAVATPLADVQARASRIAAATGGTALLTDATFGGGALPGVTVPSAGVGLTLRRLEALATSLRTGNPAVIGRIDQGRVVLDLRTVEPEREAELVEAIRRALAATG
jgi:L-seryl-tRNA(Ser) seleniumtransferase